MANHRKNTQNSLQAKTIIAGALAAGGLMLAVPAGNAFALQQTRVNAGPCHHVVRVVHQLEREIGKIFRGPIRMRPTEAAR